MCQQQHCEVRDRQFRASHCLKEFFKVKHSKPDTIIIAQQSPANTTTKSEPRTKTLPNSSQTTVFLNHSQTTNRFETRTENVKHTGEELHVLQQPSNLNPGCADVETFPWNLFFQICNIHHLAIFCQVFASGQSSTYPMDMFVLRLGTSRAWASLWSSTNHSLRRSQEAPKAPRHNESCANGFKLR